MKLPKRTLILFLAFLILATPVMATTPWTSKPPLGAQINWNHPLSRGLVACFLMNEGGGVKVIDLVGKYPFVLSGGATWKSNNKGIGINFDGINGIGVCNTNLGFTNYPISILWMGRSNSVSTEETVWCLSHTADTNNYFLISAVGNDGARGWEYQVRNNVDASNTPGFSVADSGVSIDSSCHIINCVSSNSSNHKIYVDGILKDTDTNTTNFNSPLSKHVIGGLIRSTTDYETSQSNLLIIWNRVLSPSEIRQLYIEPYCFIEYKPWTMWGAVVAAARRIMMFE